VQVKHNKVMRVLPLENEAINECWLSDRDRFSYEALNSEERLDAADGQARRRNWHEVDWQTALEAARRTLKVIA
jgi:NADH-quinone oxidoreductase subunit G